MQTIPFNLRNEIIRRLVDEFHPETIYLFGSHAWGKPTSGSDMDLLVIVENSRQKPTQRADIHAQIAATKKNTHAR